MTIRTLVLVAGLSLGFGWLTTASAAEEAAPPASLEAREVIARVNGESLYVEDVESVLGEVHKRSEEGDRSSFNLDQLMFRMVNDTLLAQEARALGMDEDPSILRKQVELREQRAKSRLYQVEIADRLEVGEDAVRDLYGELFRRFSFHMLTRKDRAEAEGLRERVLAGEQIEELARAESQDSFAVRGGRREDVKVLDLEASVAEALRSTKPGETSAVFATDVGWSIVRLESSAPAVAEEFEKWEPMTRSIALRERERELRVALLDRLRGEHAVEIDAGAVAAIGSQSMPDGRVMPKIEAPDQVVARVDARTITARELGSALASQWSRVANPEAATALKPAVLDRLVLDELIAAEAVRRGYDTTPEVERAAHALETRLLVDRYLREVVVRRVEIDRAQAEAYYAEHREEFRRPPRLHVLQLTVTDEAEAQRLAALAREGADFAWLARQHSVDPYRQSGGDRGWMPANRGLDRFADVLSSAGKGDVFGPRGRADDWQVVKVDAFEEQGYYGFDEVSGNVRQRMIDGEQMKRLDETIRTLRERSEIWINDEAIARLQVGIGLGKGTGAAHDAAPGHSGS